MKHVTESNVAQYNEEYKDILTLNNETIKVNDYIFDSFRNDGVTVGTTQAAKELPNLTDDSTIWIVAHKVKGLTNLWLTNTTLKEPWHINKVRVRNLSLEPIKVKGDPTSSHSPVRLVGPRHFDVDLRGKQFKYGLDVDTTGFKNHMSIYLDADGPLSYIKFNGWSAGGGSFAGLRLCEPPIDRIVSGEIQDFLIHDTLSECIYAGSIKETYALFNNFTIRNGALINAGSEPLQLQNFGEGCVVEDLTAIHSGVEWPSPFQNYQRGSFQFKAGGGNVKIRRLLFVGYGSPAIILFSSDKVKPGDKIEFSDIYFTNGNGPLLQVDKSCTKGAEWTFTNIHVGKANCRVEKDTNSKMPYAYLNDVFTATDKVIFNSITTDGALPLTGKPSANYIIKSHLLTDNIVQPKFKQAPFQVGEQVFNYYHVYNEVSQQQFYPTAGQPVKYYKGDVVQYKGLWYKAKQECLGSSLGPTPDNFDLITWNSNLYPTYNYEQTIDSPLLNVAGLPQKDNIDDIINELNNKIMDIQNRLNNIQTELDAAKAEAAAAEAAFQAEKSAKEQAELSLGTLATALKTMLEDLKEAGIIS